MHGYRLVLVGIGIAAMLTARQRLPAHPGRHRGRARADVWLTGSLNGRGWDQVRPLLRLLRRADAAASLAHGRALRMLELGDDTATALGVRVERVRLLLLVGVVLLAAVARRPPAGPVAFVALAAPQIARRLTRAPGPPGRRRADRRRPAGRRRPRRAARRSPVTSCRSASSPASIGAPYLLWSCSPRDTADRI